MPHAQLFDSSASSPERFTAVGSNTFFVASDASHGSELWVTDGISPGGTHMVKDIKSGTGGSGITYLTNVNGTLFFVGTDTSYGKELWKSDGTSTGTNVVSDILTGSGNGLTTSSPLTVAGGTVYFQATNGSSSGVELWQTDGTSSGTKMVRNINSGSGDSSPQYIVVAGSNNGRQAFFAADDGTNGVALWQLIVAIPGDGNLDGTVDGADYTIWADHFGLSGFWLWQQGDWNDTGTVTGADYTAWADHFGQSE